MRYHIVLDTNVILSALKSRYGASFLLLRRWLGHNEFAVHLSATLVLEYEEVLKRHKADFGWEETRIERFLVGLASRAIETPIYFRWRPFLRDADDDMVLEVAVAGGCQFLVTFNKRDFQGVEGFGLQVVTPGEFLKILDTRKIYFSSALLARSSCPNSFIINCAKQRNAKGFPSINSFSWP